jgi:PHP domain-containing protein
MRKFILSMFVAVAASVSVSATTPNKIVIPNIEGYKTLKGDFHIHTVFSDATVWPTTRVQEALWEGLDVIAISDHVDSRLQKQIKAGLFDAEKCDRDRSFEIARKAAGKKLLVIHGGEISRGMPPGHWNCLFVSDCNKICEEAEKFDDDEFKAAHAGLKEAKAQGGFTMWNHPNWEKQAPNKTEWWKEHTQLYNDGYMNGIEVYNKFAGYCPEAHQWALEKNITMFGNSDAHTPFFYMIDYLNGQHRPITLVFATEKTEEAVRDALDHQRTAVYAEEMVYGREDMLRPLFEACVKVKGVKFSDKQVSFTLVNKSCIPIRLRKAPGSEKFFYVRNYELRPFETITVTVKPLIKDHQYQKLTDKHVEVNFIAETFQIGPDKPLPVKWVFDAPEK